METCFPKISVEVQCHVENHQVSVSFAYSGTKSQLSTAIASNISDSTYHTIAFQKIQARKMQARPNKTQSLYLALICKQSHFRSNAKHTYTHSILVQTSSLMNDCGNSASIRHESAFWTLVELVQLMYGASVVVLMLDYVKSRVSVW